MKNEHLENLVVGEEHWTKKGDVDLFMWNKFLPSDKIKNGTNPVNDNKANKMVKRIGVRNIL